MAFNSTYIESIQTKHLNNVGFTSTAKEVSNEAYALKNPHQIIASQIPSVDVVGTYGIYTASGIAAGMVEEHIVKLTADVTVNGNKAWNAFETNCTTSGHSGRGALKIQQWMRVPETEYKLRLFADTGSNAPNYSSEILPSEVAFNWAYDASAGIVYFDADPTGTFTGPLWGKLYTYVGESVEEALATAASGIGTHEHDDRYYTESEIDIIVSTTSGTLQDGIDAADSAAGAAQSTANTAVTNASTAQGTANSALSAANNAQDELYIVEASVGLNTDGTLAGFNSSHYVSVSGTYKLAIEELDEALYSASYSFDTASGILRDSINDLDAELTTASGVLDSYIDSIASDLATASGTLAGLISDLDAELTTASGVLDSAIDAVAADLVTASGTLAGLISDLDAELTTASGVLDGAIDAVAADLVTASGVLQGFIDTLGSDLVTASGILDSYIDSIASDLATASGSLQNDIVWEVVDTPSEQIRPKLEHQGKSMYTYGNLTIGGDLTVSGTTTTVHSQELTVADKMITVNDGEVGAGITGDSFAGIEVDRGSETNYLFVFDEVQDNFRVGISGSLQAVATREDVPNDGYVAVWSASGTLFTTPVSLDSLATDVELSTTSGILQGLIDSLDAELTTASGVLDGAIDAVAADLVTASGTLAGLISDLDAELTTASGVLQDQIDGLELDLTTLSGALNGNMNALNIFESVGNGSETITASGTHSTLTFNGANGVTVLVNSSTNVITISGAPLIEAQNVDLTFNNNIWEYDGSFDEIPNDLIIFYNGVKQKTSDADYYTATVTSGILNIEFGFTTHDNDWVSALYNLQVTQGVVGGSTSSGTGLSPWVVKTSAYNAAAGDRILVDTNSVSAFTVNLPSSPSMGDEVVIVDAGSNCAVVNVTIGRNGNSIMGAAEDLTIDVNGASFSLIYYNSGRGWVIYE
jgi:hypothetical protein